MSDQTSKRTNSTTRDRRQRTQRRSSNRRRTSAANKHAIALGCRIMPIVVLMGGLIAWQHSIGAAQGPQFGTQSGTQRNPYGQGNNFSNTGGNRNSSQLQYGATSTNNGLNRLPNNGGNSYRIGQTPSNGNTRYDGTPQGMANGIPNMPNDAAGNPDAQADAPSESWSSFLSNGQIPEFVTKLQKGGWLMVPLGVCSLVVIALSMERLISLRRGRVIPRPFVRRFTECVEDGQLSYDEANSICEEFDCPVAEVFRAALRRWGRPMFEIEQAVIDAGDRVGDSLKRFVRVFHAISNVAPLLGLLGTVLGMIESFELISGGNPELLAAGISKALITTAAGLSVAIPAYLAYMYFSAKSDRYLVEIDKLCTKVVDSISAEALENGSAASRRKKKAA